MKSIQIYVLTLASLMGIATTSAQTNLVKGKVTDADGAALEGATVQLLRANAGTATDATGQFSLEVKNQPVGNLIVSSIGYVTTSVAYNLNESSAPLTITLKSQLHEMPRAEVVGEKETVFSRTPGSVGEVSAETLRHMAPFTGNEAFKSIAGVHVVDEEGAGLRMNLGIRGLDPDRSRSVLVLEDGIPVALAPYGEPELYYTPSIDRMERVEVLKGSGSILFGPQTIGGVVNYITADPPAESKGNIELKGGTGDFFSTHLSYGNTLGGTGFLVNYQHKQANQIGTLDFNSDDFVGKVKFAAGENTSVGLKLGYYREVSNSTYIGLTQSMYDRGEYFTVMTPEDRLNVQRVSGSLSANHFFTKQLKWTNTLFAYTTDRNWKRQDFVSNSFDSEGNLKPKPADFSGVTWGDESIAGGAIYMRNRTGNRDRQFAVAGAESKISLTTNKGEYSAGLRQVTEKALEQRINGTRPFYDSGSLAEDEVRTGRGLSAFVHGKHNITKAFSLTAGVRAEHFDYERQIRRGTYNNSVRDTNITKHSQVLGLIPGAGFNLNLGQKSTLFGGLHKGFAPPRVKDAISNQGEVYELKAEESINYELGVRTQTKARIDFEVNLFMLDFKNQIIPVSESSGGTGAGLVNGGQTIHRGAEVSMLADLGKMLNQKFTLQWMANATFVDARLGNNRFATVGEENVNVKNNRTPYAPELLVNSMLVFELPMGLGANIRLSHTGAQFTDILNTETPTADGRDGKIEAYTLLDAGMWYNHHKTGLTFRLSAKNLSDERYIASRRPQGIRTGTPRLLMGSISFDF